MAIDKYDIFKVVGSGAGGGVDADDIRTAVDDLRTTIGSAGYAAVRTSILNTVSSLAKEAQVTVLTAIVDELIKAGDASVIASVESDWPASVQALPAARKMRLVKGVLILMGNKGLDEIPD